VKMGNFSRPFVSSPRAASKREPVEPHAIRLRSRARCDQPSTKALSHCANAARSTPNDGVWRRAYSSRAYGDGVRRKRPTELDRTADDSYEREGVIAQCNAEKIFNTQVTIAEKRPSARTQPMLPPP